IDDQRIFGHVPRTKRFSREKEIFRVDLVLLHEGAFRPPAPKAAAWAPARGKTVTLAVQRTTARTGCQVGENFSKYDGFAARGQALCRDCRSLTGRRAPPMLTRHGVVVPGFGHRDG